MNNEEAKELEDFQSVAIITLNVKTHKKHS
jgi:hypothetical protein